MVWSAFPGLGPTSSSATRAIYLDQLARWADTWGLPKQAATQLKRCHGRYGGLLATKSKCADRERVSKYPSEQDSEPSKSQIRVMRRNVAKPHEGCDAALG